MANTPGTNENKTKTKRKKNGMKSNAIEATEIASKAVFAAALAWNEIAFSYAVGLALTAKRCTTDDKCNDETTSAAYSQAAAAFDRAAAGARFADEAYTRTAEALRAAACAHVGV